MTIELLELQDGGTSLEFEEADIAAVLDVAHARFGKLEVERHVLHAIYRFGGCEFIFQNEWDDPCLIAGGPEGVEILRALCADLNDGVVRIQQPFERRGDG